MTLNTIRSKSTPYMVYKQRARPIPNFHSILFCGQPLPMYLQFVILPLVTMLSSNLFFFFFHFSFFNPKFQNSKKKSFQSESSHLRPIESLVKKNHQCRRKQHFENCSFGKILSPLNDLKMTSTLQGQSYSTYIKVVPYFTLFHSTISHFQVF